MNFVRAMIEQPVTVVVGVILTIMAGLLALRQVPIQLTPNVEDTIIAVTTRWEGASPDEIEREIVERQEEMLQGIANLRAMTSTSSQGQGQIRLEFNVGTNKDDALREVSDKLREVPEYPDNVKEPVIEASDPQNRDYITWIVLSTTDPNFDVRTLQDFAHNHIEPVIERVDGVSEVNVLGGREREAQIRYRPTDLAAFGITPTEFVTAIRGANANVSGGELKDGKFNVRLRTIGQFDSVDDVLDTVIAFRDNSPVYLSQVADVVETYKEPSSFVRSKGRTVIAINAQKEVGANVIAVMAGIRKAIDQLNQPGGVLANEAAKQKINGEFKLTQVYDQTIYIDDALALVRSNIWVGSVLAIIILVLFLRSIRPVLIISLAIPISVVGAIVVMLAMGRSVNVISLAGMAFAVGMVVDNAIVVLENIFRHLELGKKPARAALDGTSEVWGAVLASTLTTLVVFIPILLIQEEAGQLFRDISIAICAAVGLSFIVSITVIPCAAARVLRHSKAGAFSEENVKRGGFTGAVSRAVHAMCGSVAMRIGVVAMLTVVSLFGTGVLMPPADYLPTGNRNLVFGIIFTPPGYNINQQYTVGDRVEKTIRPFWEAGLLEEGSEERRQAEANLPSFQTFDFARGKPGPTITPPALDNYFFVGFGSTMFHGAISANPKKVPDVVTLLQTATGGEAGAGIMAFAQQVPLFRLGGNTGSAVKIEMSGDDLNQVTRAAVAARMGLIQQFGPYSVQAQPSNFDVFGPEISAYPRKRDLAQVGMTPRDLGLALQASGDGAIIGEYRVAGESIDLKLIDTNAVDQTNLVGLADVPVATPLAGVVPVSSLADIKRITSPPEITHVGRQRAVTLQFTPPAGLPLQQAIDGAQGIIHDLQDKGQIPPTVTTNFTGSASKLASVKRAMLGDGTLLSTITSSLVLALMVVYLLMCVLFQSFSKPLIVMFSVPLATVGGFAALRMVHIWSSTNRYMPEQNFDILTMLGFVILIGVVVNNAILIVHQSLQYMKNGIPGLRGMESSAPARDAIAESVRTRMRPIFMSSLTSIGGLAPLVLMPGAGSELYRGLGSVVLGGLLVSTIFTIVLVPLLLSLVLDLQAWIAAQLSKESVATPVATAKL
ncbi:MAG: efflux RND transporter permease subunit [Phycisphaeraceae bacterium]|nr:efflux RND transporter permease subunit [Phycisphaerales bacterium]MCB9860668.1 efflux RND transporter permease subunit [Phycisphaeraceae bacterium]